MTERLYYESPHTSQFDATVTAVDVADPHFAVKLDRTAFYPTTGGQPFDTGTLGPARVVDVVESDDGDVIHVVEGPRLHVGQRVHGVVDWPRRFDHMQQHTGQHVLSAAIDRLFGVRTVSFHLGAEASTIDVTRELAPQEIAAAEDEANRIVWEDHPVTIRFVSAEEAARLPLRKEPARQGRLRLIDIDHFDLSACGGTHVSRTGSIGIIGVTAWERFKGGQRLEFTCGSRTLARLRSLRDAVAGSIRRLSVGPSELPEAIERLQSEAKEQKRANAALRSELIRYHAEELANAAEIGTSGRLTLRGVDADAEGLKMLASAIVARSGHLVVLVSNAVPAAVVVARSADLALRANDVLAALLTKFGGRGGGKPEFAQGGGLDARPDAILVEARRILANPSNP